ncbi:MAG: hypothetical protein AAF512_14445 [Pseudomonadota bacterium]
MPYQDYILTHFKVFTLSIAAFWIAGCGVMPGQKSSPEEVAGEGMTVWSEDGSEALIAIQQGWESPRSETERFEHRLFIDAMDGSERRALTSMRPNAVNTIYYMKNAGYVIVENRLPDKRARFQKIELNGKEITLFESRTPVWQLCGDVPTEGAPVIEHTIIPSPNGESLAHVYSQACGSVTVDFLRARDLVATDSQTLTIESPPNITWHPDGDLIIAMADGETAWKLMAGLYQEKTDYPKCFDPKTSSSNVARDGRQIYLGDGKLETREVGREQAFGCQR